VEFRATPDGRWVLGDPNAKCPHCGHEAAVHYAANGRAEVWHAPTDCCAYSKARERKFDEMRQEGDERAERARMEAEAAMNPNPVRTAA
jgi:hypothetical protein